MVGRTCGRTAQPDGGLLVAVVAPVGARLVGVEVDEVDVVVGEGTVVDVVVGEGAVVDVVVLVVVV